ncbi:uncharacterized protein LOC119600437 [Lucilia sericata]|uniref:uncharacterized protein LOC119600437 n=1 Tax=Lucilia sericata TaxID=13632 RepID=UPI0018A84176|nr:uncharacterized protein LOC119600437 [Lucilia sericata]
MWLQLVLYVIFLKPIQSEQILKTHKFAIESEIFELIHTTEQQNDIQTILIKYEESVKNCGDLDLYIKYLNATLIIENLLKSWSLKDSLNTNLMCVVCLKKLTSDFAIELAPYFKSLISIRETKMLIYMHHNESGNYTPFPNFTLEMRQHKEGDLLYTNRVKDLKGHVFLTLPDQVVPRTFLTVNKNGKVKISGYVGHFIHLLAEYLNATLKFPFPVKKGDVLFYGYLETLTRNYTIDLPGTLVPVINAQQMIYYSYPFEVMNACLMIPKAKYMPLKEVRHRRGVVKHYVKFSDYILNDVALRGILGQPFKVWLKAGLYLSLIYNAFLQTFSTQPFKEKQLKTFTDLYENNIYTLLSDREVSYFSGANKNFKLLHRITNYEEYNKMRNRLNTSYAYPTIGIHWNSLFSHQQNILKNKLFIFSEDACMFHTNVLSFPLAENSIYRTPVHNLIMIARDFGLINRWLTINFPDDLAKDKLPSMLDWSGKVPGERPLKLQDFELLVGGRRGIGTIIT